jgi:hypothetical protein
MVIGVRSLVIALIILLHANNACAQRFFIEKSSVIFFSDGVIEDIKAENVKATSIFDSNKGDIALLIGNKDFQFSNKLMQTHFNEKYMESEKYPKSIFQGKVTGFSMAAQGKQPVKAKGKFTIHGVTKEVEIPGTIENTDNKLLVRATFMVKLKDYNIVIPKILWENIAEEVQVTIDLTYRAM